MSPGNGSSATMLRSMAPKKEHCEREAWGFARGSWGCLLSRPPVKGEIASLFQATSRCCSNQKRGFVGPTQGITTYPCMKHPPQNPRTGEDLRYHWHFAYFFILTVYTQNLAKPRFLPTSKRLKDFLLHSVMTILL